MEVGVGQRHVVLDWNPAPLIVLWPNGWMDQDAPWYRGVPRVRPHCVRWGPSSPKKGTATPFQIFGPYLLWIKMPCGTKVGLGPGYIVNPAPQKGHRSPTFWSMSIVVKRLN